MIVIFADAVADDRDLSSTGLSVASVFLFDSLAVLLEPEPDLASLSSRFHFFFSRLSSATKLGGTASVPAFRVSHSRMRAVPLTLDGGRP